jgi:hypothetical protein
VKKTRKPKKPTQPRVATAQPDEQPAFAIEPEPTSEVSEPEQPTSGKETEPVAPAEIAEAAPLEVEPLHEPALEAEPNPEEAPPASQELPPREPDSAAVACEPGSPCACKTSRPKVPTAVLVQRHETRLLRLDDRIDDLDVANRIILESLHQLKSQVHISYSLILLASLLALAVRLFG